MNYKLCKFTIILILISIFSIHLYAKESKGAEYRTKAAYTYGRFEINYKSIPVEGLLATFLPTEK